jgi:hypothetical protein
MAKEELLGHTAGKMRKNRIRVLTGGAGARGGLIALSLGR